MKTAACISTLAIVFATQNAGAQSYPSKPVRLVAGAATGSASDTAARIIAEPLSGMWKRQVVVENRPGAGGVPAAEIVSKATPDGHTLLLCSIASHGIGPVLRKNLPYDHLKDFTPVTRIGSLPNAMMVHPSLPVKTVKDFVAHAKANPGKLQYGSSGVGNSPHLTMELFRAAAGITLNHVPQKPGQPTNDELVAGRLSVAFNNLPSAPPLLKDGKVRALAVTSAKRNAQLPDTPTLIESGFPGMEVTVWSGLCGPAKLAKPVVAKLNADLAKVLSIPEIQKRYAERGGEVKTSTPEEFVSFIKSENAKWAKAAKSAGIEPQ